MPPKRKKTPSLPAAPAQAPKKPRLDTHLPSPTPTPTDEDAAIPERVDSRHLFGGPGSRARLALDLPPMHSLDDIYASMTSHAMTNGLGGFLGHMNRPLRVATVCSGTESPLLALEMVQRCMFPLSLSFLFLVGCLSLCVCADVGQACEIDTASPSTSSISSAPKSSPSNRRILNGTSSPRCSSGM